jgi:SAM-dependent methyltransferase
VQLDLADRRSLADIPKMGDASGNLAALYERYGKDAVESQLAALARHGTAVDDTTLWLKAALSGNFKFMPMEHVHSCPCGSTRTTSLGRFVFWNLLGLRECDRCGLLIVSPRLTKDAMNAVFAEHYFDHSDLELWGARRSDVFADIFRVLKSRGVRTVFDVGAAYGHFVKYANEMGLNAAGSDISPQVVVLGRQRLGVDVRRGSLEDLALPNGSVDAVVSLDAFYYVAEPRAELDAMRRLVKPGGIIVLRLRNCLWTRVVARVSRLREIGRPPVPLPHLWGFTPRSISTLLGVSGWLVEEVQPAAYSRSRYSQLQFAAVRLNRLARRAWKRAPIFTRSFNVVARRVA